MKATLRPLLLKKSVNSLSLSTENHNPMKRFSSILTILFLSITTAFSQQTAEEIISSIIKETGAKQIPNTVDVIKEGDPKTKVTGIITTMFATMDVLKKAVEMNCNLIIVHEPLYYSHLDETKALQNNSVFLQKQKFILDNKLVIWRFHDYIHSIRPDGIMEGMVTKLGWKQFIVGGNYSQFTMPETTLGGLLANLKKTFPQSTFYVIGNKEMKVKNVRFAPGAPGSSMHIRLLEDKNVDVVVAGESQHWETYEYARDAVGQGKNKAIIFLGHVASEEGGMEHCASWLKGFIKDTPIHFVESGPAYWAY